MPEKDNSAPAVSLLTKLASTQLARNGLSPAWLPLGAFVGICLLAIVLLANSKTPEIDCDQYSNHAYLNCQDTNAAGEIIGDSHRERGQALMDEGKYADALEELDEALHLDPTDYQSRFNRAEALFKLGQIELADKDYETLAKTGPYAVEAFLRRADMFHEIGDDTRAVIETTRAIDLVPADIELRLQRALSYMGMRSYDLALSDINHVLELQPDYFDALRLRAHALLHIGHYAEATQDFDRAIATVPKDQPYPEMWYGRARTALLSKATLSSDEFRRVLDDMKTASDQSKSDASWQNQICYDLTLFDHAIEALPYCDLGITLMPEDGAVRDSRAYAYARLERWSDAIQEWNKALTLAPDTATYLFGRGFAHEQLGDIPAANADYAAARLADKDIDRLMHKLGILAGTGGISRGPKEGL